MQWHQGLELPWLLLQRAADQYLSIHDSDQLRHEIKNAIIDGREKWADARAVELLIHEKDEAGEHVVKTEPQKWLQLTTESAASGNPESCFELGKHYSITEGWHPWHRKGQFTGWQTPFWLEAWAALSTEHASEMAWRYLGAVTLLYEMGQRDQALKTLDGGVQALSFSNLHKATSHAQWLDDYRSSIKDGKLQDFANSLQWLESDSNAEVKRPKMRMARL
jgi:hypothetical protein